MSQVNNLSLPNVNLGPLASPKRLSSIELALSWESGTFEKKHYITLYRTGDFEVCLGKPGKEAQPDYAKLNENDMTPTILFHGEVLDFFPTFSDIFEDFQRIGATVVSTQRESVLEILGCLLYRSSFMLDHELIDGNNFQDNGGQRWHWKIPSNHLETLQNKEFEVGRNIETSKGTLRLPIDVYLHLVDAIALNEDVKYQAKNVLGTGKVNRATGRTNTLQTLAAIIAVFLNRYPLSKFADTLIRGRGVASLTVKAAKTAFPELA